MRDIDLGWCTYHPWLEGSRAGSGVRAWSWHRLPSLDRPWSFVAGSVAPTMLSPNPSFAGALQWVSLTKS